MNDKDDEPDAGDTLTVIGFGRTEDGAKPKVLQKAEVSYFDDDDCEDIYDDFDDGSMMCALGDGTDRYVCSEID
jgi:hypothetical protein